MIKLRVPNPIDDQTRPSELEKHLSQEVLVTRQSVSFDVHRGQGQEAELIVDDDDVLELELDDGHRLWIRADDIEDDLGASLLRSENEEGATVFRIPRELPSRSISRGAGKWVIQGLKVLGVDIAGSISDFVTEKVEGKQVPAPGLYRCTPAGSTALQAVEALDKSKPILVFVHGTASSTEGSFDALWQSGAGHLSDLLSHYGGQVLAFQHRTLSQSPVENALELINALDAVPSTVQGRFPLRLHLVTHSRGGLIGELLCRATRMQGTTFDQDDLALFAEGRYQRDQQALSALGPALVQSALQIERFIRVACPARGTTLADGRLDRYLSGIVNVLDKVPGISNPVFEGITSLMLAVIHRRTDPEELPGLEAMMPTSPTVRMLNRPDITVAADLHVIGGDVAASGFFHRIKVLITDLFYREDHDLVVNTPSMFGGAKRSAGIRYWIDTGGHVDHFRYFSNSSTASRVVAGLRHRNSELFRALTTGPDRVSEGDYIKRTIGPQADVRSAGPKPIVFVVPGIMGSHLAVDGDRVWLDYLTIARGQVAKLAIDAGTQVQTDSLLGDAYGKFLQYLAVTHDVRPFAYDWRASIDTSAELLRQAIESAVQEAEALDQPVRIVAHSMGGLVVRAMLTTDSGQALWQRMGQHRGSRLLMLGVPNGGAHAMAAMLMGRDAVARKLALLDVKNSLAELLRVFSRFDGVLQLLPNGGSLDLFHPDSWQYLQAQDDHPSRGLFSQSIASSKSAGIAWSIPDSDQLGYASRLRRRLDASPIDAERMIYVAGTAPETPVDITIDESARIGHRVQVYATAEGDGRVPWSTGIPAELPARQVYYMDAAHGDLAANESTFAALLQLLETGVTQQLSNNPIRHRGQRGETFILPPAFADMYPDRADLVAAVLGGQRHQHRAGKKRCHVRIVHGDLARSPFPVTVGHYKGGVIASAQDYLDRQLSGRLRERHRLGIYPEAVGSSLILLNSPGAPADDQRATAMHPGAIVVGLGAVGDLTPGALTSTLTEGLMRYALEVREACETHSKQRAEVSAPVTSLLISASSDLTLSDSLSSILRAVDKVNQHLAPPEHAHPREPGITVTPSVRIDKLDIIEYLEDRALQAAHTLDRLAATQQFDSFEFHRQVVEGSGGRSRACFDSDVGWWQRLRISTQAGGEFKFEALSERARVESFLQSTQRNLVDQLLSRAARSAHDPTLGKTLFELLIPNAMKQGAPDRRDLVLMVDEGSAAYPWELLQDGNARDARPLAVEAGLIRQRVSVTFRPQPQMATGSMALVVGDPAAHEPTGATLARLPGAASEARQVTEQLNRAGYATESLIGENASALDVITRLYQQPYRILHIAAHGVFKQRVDEKGRIIKTTESDEQADPDTTGRVSGVVLSDGIYLTPNEFEQMRHVPELAFINCCHLGDQSGDARSWQVDYHRLAANVATQLIRMGVRAVIAAGWAVDDAAARHFANIFYARMLANSTFGDAVTDARRSTFQYEQGRGSNTWGAYQCYGDPEFRLVNGSSSGASRSDTGAADMPLSPTELITELHVLVRRATHASAESLPAMRAAFEQRIKHIPEHWYDYGTVCSALASAYAAFGDLRQAAELFQRACHSTRADAPIRSIEHLVNLRARWAMDQATRDQATDEDKATALSELTAAAKLVDTLLDISITEERFALKGSIHKRQSMLAATPATQRDRLKAMAEAYDQARALASSGGKASSHAIYALQNSLAACITRFWGLTAGRYPKQKAAYTQEKTSIETNLEQLKHDIDHAADAGSDFWADCREPDRLLLEVMHQRTLSDTQITAIAQGYQAASRIGVTGREIKTISEHLSFFRCMAARQLKGAEKDALCQGIEKLRGIINEELQGN